MSRFRSIAHGTAVAVVCLGLAGTVRAATPLTALRYAADITVDLSDTILTPAEVGEDDLAGMVATVDVGELPADAHIDAYLPLDDRSQLLSFDTAVRLPGLVPNAADVVRYANGSYSLAFDAAAAQIPEGVNVDAVAMFNGDLLLSFDTAVQLDGVTFEDEDLARFSRGSFAPFFLGASSGVPPDLDLDGAQVLSSQRLLVSFDGSGDIDGIEFNDEDVLEYDSGSGVWEMAYRGSVHHPGWTAGDLVALHAFIAGPSPTPTATPMTPAAGTPTATATGSPTLVTPPPATSTATATGSPTLVTPPPATSTATAMLTPEATTTNTASPPVTPTTPSESCVGDCDGNGEVTIDELITMVSIALGNRPVSACLPGDPSGNGEITIEELVVAVNNALNGC